MDMDFSAWTAEDSTKFLAVVAKLAKIPATQIVATYRAGSVIADLRLRKDVSTPDKLDQLSEAIDFMQIASPQYRININVVVQKEEYQDEEEATPEPPLPDEASRAPKAPRGAGVVTEDNVAIYAVVIACCMVIVCCVAGAYYYYAKYKKTPKMQKGHIENFTIPERKLPPIPKGFGPSLQAVFPQLKARDEEMPEVEKIDVVVTTDSESAWPQSESGSRSVSKQKYAQGSTLRAPEICTPGDLHFRQPTPDPQRVPPTMDVPGAICETEADVSPSSKEMARVYGRHALWNNGVAGEDTADTVTTARLGTISRSPQRTPQSSDLEQQQRSKLILEQAKHDEDNRNRAEDAEKQKQEEQHRKKMEAKRLRLAQSGGLTVSYPERLRNDSVFNETDKTTDAHAPSWPSAKKVVASETHTGVTNTGISWRTTASTNAPAVQSGGNIYERRRSRSSNFADSHHDKAPKEPKERRKSKCVVMSDLL